MRSCGRPVAQPARAARRETGRRPLRARTAVGSRPLRGRAPVRQRGRRVADLPYCRGVARAQAAARREGQYLVDRPSRPAAGTWSSCCRTSARRRPPVGDLARGCRDMLRPKPSRAARAHRGGGGLGAVADATGPSSKLARVAVQVERARDLEDEVKKRLPPLTLQATAAERAEKLGARDRPPAGGDRDPRPRAARRASRRGRCAQGQDGRRAPRPR